ncbi:MAG TPA: glycine cleavage T C-terminal barrel domain-containing protein [Kofleriaceae bacterium]|nr:glycine cleavage T C-terminal barrel domain-containing protein [Kofleriaceae bacterium]
MTAPIDREVHALRTATTLAAGDHIACVRVRGSDAADALDRVSPRAVFARTGKMTHTLVLDDDARPVADIYLCCDEDDWFVLAEGMPAPAVIDHLRAHAGGLDVALDDLTASHAMVTLNGPYAWELLGELTTPDVIGLPYLGFFHADAFTCFRGGKTGEYGYDLLVERGRLPALRDQILTVGQRFELAEISLAALEVAQLENLFWNPRRDWAPGLTPIELQLQWRVSYDRAFPGAAALHRRRQAAHRRAVLLCADRALAADARVIADRRDIGSVLHAGWSPTRGDWLAIAIVERALAHAGLGFEVGGVAARTLSAPSIDNRSLLVDPQRHSFATRDTDGFPPLVRR